MIAIPARQSWSINRYSSAFAPTSTPRVGSSGVVYVNGSHDHAARRPVEAPAPTIMFGSRSNRVVWERTT